MGNIFWIMITFWDLLGWESDNLEQECDVNLQTKQLPVNHSKFNYDTFICLIAWENNNKYNDMSVNFDTYQANTSACLWISSAVIPWVRFSVLTDSVNLGSQNLTSPALLKIAKIVSSKRTVWSNSTSNESCMAAV